MISLLKVVSFNGCKYSLTGFIERANSRLKFLNLIFLRQNKRQRKLRRKKFGNHEQPFYINFG